MDYLHTLLIPGEFIPARFILRSNRFVAQVQVEKEIHNAHVPTSGRLGELLHSGAEVMLRKGQGQNRSTSFDLMLVKTGETWVSLDSRLPNYLVGQLLRNNRLEPFGPVSNLKPEAKHGESRLDFAFTDQAGQQTLVEVKSVTLVEEGLAMFPDAPTARGTRHLQELSQFIAQGYRAAVIFIIQRDDALCFSPNRRTDGAFTQALVAAQNQGVEVYAWLTQAQAGSLTLLKQIPVDLEGGTL
jgi:sugar fermentation stimulation protein A